MYPILAFGQRPAGRQRSTRCCAGECIVGLLAYRGGKGLDGRRPAVPRVPAGLWTTTHAGKPAPPG